MSDPKLYRRQAVECRLSAKQSVSHDVKQHFLDVAVMWDRIAADLEYTQSLMLVLAEIAATSERLPDRFTTSTEGTTTVT